jgi:hypothetical protein
MPYYALNAMGDGDVWIPGCMPAAFLLAFESWFFRLRARSMMKQIATVFSIHRRVVRIESVLCVNSISGESGTGN